MSVEKLERVLWRVRKNNPNTKRITYYALKRAIMYECGTDPKTYKSNVTALRTLGWIKKHSQSQCELTDKDLTEG